LVDRSVLRKRYGSTIKGATMSERVMRGGEFDVAGVKYEIRIGLDEIHEWNAGSSPAAWDDVTGSDLTGTTSDPFSLAVPLLSGVRIATFSNYIDNIRKYTGAGNTADLGGSPPKAKFLLAFDEYLLLAFINDGTERPMRVQWPNTADPETWTGGNSGAKDLIEDGQDITGMAAFGNFAAVHKQTAIYLGYKVTTSSIFKFDRKNVVGTIANNTIQNLPNGLQAYLANDGIRLFNGISAPLIESSVTDELRDSINPEYVTSSWSIVIPELDEYWVAVPIGSQTTPDTIYKYNYKNGTCHRDVREGITAAWKYTNTVQPNWDDLVGSWDSQTWRWDDRALLNLFQLTVFGDSAGITTTRDITVNSDNAVAIDAYWESKDFTSEELGRLVRWQKIDVWAKGNSCEVAYSTDSGETWTLIEDISLNASYPTDDDPDELWHDVLSSKIRYRFKNDTAGETFSVKQFIVSYINREMRG